MRTTMMYSQKAIDKITLKDLNDFSVYSFDIREIS